MSFSRVHFSAITVEHATPSALFEELDHEFKFTLDAAARGRDETKEEFLERKIRLAAIAIDRGADEQQVIESARSLRPFTKNNKCSRFFDETRSAFTHAWAKSGVASRVFCNPPYGRGLARWIARGRDQLIKGHAEVVVWLLPARTDTRWFHQYFWDDQAHAPKTGVEMRFRMGRVKFGDAKSGAPFPTMVVIDRRLVKD